MRVANSAIVAEFMHSCIIAQHRTPKKLLTDHGTPFASQVIATLCQRYGIRKFEIDAVYSLRRVTASSSALWAT